MLFGDDVDSIDIARSTPDVYPDDASRTRSDQCLDLFGVEVVRLRIDIAEHRRDFLPGERMRRCHESKRRHDDLSRPTESADGHLQRDGGIASKEAVTDPEQCRKFRL